MNALVVHCRAMTKNFGAGAARVLALRGVDLDVFSGELMMLVGPSGCGKTTLISIISSILDLDDGVCEVLGQDVQRMTKNERARFRGEVIGFIFQAFNLLPALSAVENVSVPLLLRGVKRNQAEARSRALLEKVGLAARADATPSALSGGEQQRVAIGRALVHDPKLIICDEPTSNLDTLRGHDMMTILRDVARAPDRTIIVVTHDTRMLEYADRIARMEDGRVVEVGAGPRQQNP